MGDSIPNLFNTTVINDSIIFNDILIADSVSVDSMPVKEVVNFLKLGDIVIKPMVKTINSEVDIITYILIALLGIIAVIWRFMPGRFSMIFSLKTDNQFPRSGGSNVVVPGTLITGFFWINFIVALAIFSYLLIQTYTINVIAELALFQLFGYIFLLIGSLLLYRIIIIFGTAKVFQTQKMMQQQMTVGRNLQFISGVILVPIIILIYYLNVPQLIVFTLVVLAFLQIIRVGKIILIGKSNTMFSTLHIILYLCALEMVPVLVLIRMIGNAFGV